MTLPRLSNGRLPVAAGSLCGVSAWKVARIIHAMVIGIESKIDDKAVGTIPAKTPLSIEQACRAMNLMINRGRRLYQEPVFQASLKLEIEVSRTFQEPKNIAIAAQIRDNHAARDRDRINAIECIRGPRPVAGVNVNIQQNNAAMVHPAGYVIGHHQANGYVVNLGTPMKELEQASIEEKITAASPRANAGDAAKDAAKQRAEEHAVRPSRG